MDIGSNVANTGTYIETVRSLHQTVTALRSALEESKKEILLLKTKVWPIESIEQSLTALAIENHALRRKLLEKNVDTYLPQKKELSVNKHEINDPDATLFSSKPTECQNNLKTNIAEHSQENKIVDSDSGIVSSEIKNCEQPSAVIESVNAISLEQSKSELCDTNESTNISCEREVKEQEQILPPGVNREYLEAPDLNSVEQKPEFIERKHDLVSTDHESVVLELKKQPKSTGIKTFVFSETLNSNIDSQEQSIEKKVIEEDKPTNVDGLLFKGIGEKSNLKSVNKVKKVFFTENLPKISSIVTDSKKAKKGKRSKSIAALKSVQRSRIRASIQIKARTSDPKKKSKSLDSLTVVKTPSRVLKLSKTAHFFNLKSTVSCEITDFSNMSHNNNSETKSGYENEQELKTTNNIEEKCLNESEQEPEVDDIELIFTTDDTKESDFKEQLVSIDSVDGQNNASSLKLLVPDHEQSVDISDRELDDDVFDSSFDQESKDCNALQVFQLERENSQLYNSKSDNSINQEDRSLRSYYSYQDSSFENKSIEKDESFDRFEERIRIVETDISKVGITEVDYAGIRRNTCPNPLQYRPLLHREAINKGLNVKKSRPILAHSSAIRRESGAQTDISALPGSAWRSESSLANKVHLGDHFTTLPSKFPLPGSRLKLSEKTTVEARRVLLSDIGFTSMVPELSRSADHLCPNLKPPVTTYGQYLRTPELYSPAFTSQRFTWTTTTATPSEGSHSHSRYSINPLTPPVQTRRCSAPVSPSRRGTLKSTSSRVRFANGSLPELRGDWTQMTADSGDSTDSLVDEAENYLRRSIDCILGTSKVSEIDTRRSNIRRASAPESAGDYTPPQGWQPFLPRQPRDLKPDHWVKVITPEGKVKGGRVRYIGPVVSQVDQFVGVQLAVPEGHSDGTYNTRRYFQCEPYHGIFVPFKKVIMGWRP